MNKFLTILFLLPVTCFGQVILTTNNHQTVTNKTMDYNSNTFLNFPAIDTSNKWVQNIYDRSDSLFKDKNGTETFINRYYPYNTNPLNYLITISANAPLSGSGTSGSHLLISQANTSTDGYLSSTDWNTFNNKGSGTVTSVTGTSNRITSSGGATPAIDISASYVGQSSITTLGTIATGTWAATPTDYTLQAQTALGSVSLAQTFGLNIFNCTAAASLADGQVKFIAVYLPKSATITGVKFFQSNSGNYTADNYNGVGLYSYSGGTLTLVASSTNDGNIWKATSNTWSSKAFTSTYSASAGIYFVAVLYNNSSQSSAPSIIGSAGLGNGALNTFDFTNSAKLCSTLSSQTALPSPTQVMSGLTSTSSTIFVELY